MKRTNFYFDEETLKRLRERAEELDRPLSWIVRKAVRQYLGMEFKINHEPTN